jgi:hypothetical protein
MTNTLPQQPALVVSCHCGTLCYRAKFTTSPEWRLVEDGHRGRGQIALTFPLIEGEPILGHVTRKRSNFRLHQHAAFSSQLTRSEAKASTRPEVKPVGNLHDLLSTTCTGGGK